MPTPASGVELEEARRAGAEAQKRPPPPEPPEPPGDSREDDAAVRPKREDRPPAGRGRFLQCARHGRFIAPDVTYHVVFKTLQSRFLLRPDDRGELRDLVTGVIARARRNWPAVSLFAATFLSTHAHMLLQGPPAAVAAFIGFTKREISRRWGPKVGWSGPMWDRYHATAVITEAAQERCLKYVLAQSVKELLCARPEDWPGFHCAPALMTGEPMSGHWLNATQYGHAKHRAQRRGEALPDRASYLEPESLQFDPIPAWAQHPPEQYRSAVQRLVVETALEAERVRQDRGLGQPDVSRVLEINPMARVKRPPADSFPERSRRRRLIAWDDLRAPEVKAYLRRYWRFQHGFRASALRLLQGELGVKFPACAFRPGFAQERCAQGEQRQAA